MPDPQCFAVRAPYVVRAIGTEPEGILLPMPPDVNRLRAALERIASTSPREWSRVDGGRTERCIHCRALIDEARDALGWARWPAATGTPA